MKASDFLLIYCPMPSTEKAEEIAKHLLSLEVIACANLFPSVTSLYKWKEQIQTSKECVMILKTKKELCSQVFEEVTKKHPYECPSLSAFTMEEATDSFLNWINRSVSDKKES